MNVPLVAAAVTTVVAVLILVVLHATGSKLFSRLEGDAVDARFAIRGPRAPASDRVVIIGMDDATRAAAPDLFQTRNGWVRFYQALDRYEPKYVALDLFYSAREVVLPNTVADHVLAVDTRLNTATDPLAAATDPQIKTAIAEVTNVLRADDHLAAELARSRRMFLGSYLYIDPDNTPTTRANAPEPLGLDKAHHGEVADAGGGGDRRPLTASTANYTLDLFARGAVGGGMVNHIDDPDGVARRMPLAVQYADHTYLPLGLAVALADLGRPNDTRYVVGDDHLVAADRTIHLGASASVVLDVLGRDRIPHVSGADILSGKAPKSALAGKLAFIGYTFGAFDKVATPLDPHADGVELHATLAENFLADRLLVSHTHYTTLLSTLLLGLVVTGAQVRRIRRRGSYLPPLVALLALAAFCVISYLLFTHGHLIEVAKPILATSLVLIAATVAALATEGREKAQLRAVFSQYVSRAVVDRIVADPARARLGGERKDLTVLFSDIRGFSLFSEGMPPEDLAQLLSDYLTPMTELVLASGGTLDKYIGDAVMAIWGAPIDDAAHAAHACEVALRMQEVLVELNRAWAAAATKRPPLAIGIGVNTGAMAVGNMGSAARFDYTVLGDQVNLASRLEALTKEYGVGILVGEGTARAAGDRFVFREIDRVRVKGRAGAAPVYELVGRAGAAVDPRFADALAAYRAREFAAARDAFAAIARDAPADRAAAILAARCDDLASAPPPPDWDGVYDQRSK